MRNSERNPERNPQNQTSSTHQPTTKTVRRSRSNNSRDNPRTRGGGFGNRPPGQRRNFVENKAPNRIYEPHFDIQFGQAPPENTQFQQPRFDGTKLNDPEEFPELDQITHPKNSNRQTTTRKASVPLEVISSKPIKAGPERRVFNGRESESRQVVRRNSANNEPTIMNEIHERSIHNNRGSNYTAKTAKRSEGVRPTRIAQPSGPVPFAMEYSPRYMIPMMEQPQIPQLFFQGNPIVSPPSIDGYITMPGDSTADHEESAYYKTCVNDESLPHLEKIRKQTEFYFSSVNLKSDVYLRSHMDEKGYVPISTILSFPRICRLKATEDDIFVFTVPGSKLECNEEKTHIRRVEDAEKWTDAGLYNEVMSVFQLYCTHPEFYSWYEKAVAHISSLPQVEQKVLPIPYQHQIYQEGQKFFFDEKLGGIYKTPPIQYVYVQQMYIVPYDFGSYGQMYPADPSQFPPMIRAAAPYRSPVDTQSQQEFIEVVRSGVSTDEVASQAAESSVQVVEVAQEERNSEGSRESAADATEMVSVYNVRKESRKQKASRGKTGVKMDRHGSTPQKNVKADVHRDSARRVESGLESYYHEENKRSTSKHGALSSNPEATPNIYISSKNPMNVAESSRSEKEKASPAPVTVMTEKMGALSINGGVDQGPTRGSLTH